LVNCSADAQSEYISVHCPAVTLAALGKKKMYEIKVPVSLK